jgi:hypothetical protein
MIRHRAGRRKRSPSTPLRSARVTHLWQELDSPHLLRRYSSETRVVLRARPHLVDAGAFSEILPALNRREPAGQPQYDASASPIPGETGCAHRFVAWRNRSVCSLPLRLRRSMYPDGRVRRSLRVAARHRSSSGPDGRSRVEQFRDLRRHPRYVPHWGNQKSMGRQGFPIEPGSSAFLSCEVLRVTDYRNGDSYCKAPRRVRHDGSVRKVSTFHHARAPAVQ